MWWRIFGGVSAVFAGVAARKVLVKGWQLATGDDPPANPEAPDTTWQEALGWALVSGAVMGVARMLATRKAASYYRRSTGHLPPGMEEVT
ncbi:MAG: hypothetical protein QOI54_689 [Actinomycetota bacterium]|jgi:hypothetical protein|nr:hypothetical protein [Actinomycetota bacterium]